MTKEEVERAMQELLANSRGNTAVLDGVGKRFTQFEADQKGLIDRVTKLEEFASGKKRFAPQPNQRHGVPIVGLEDEKQAFSFSRAIWAIATGDWSEAGFEQDCFRQTRALSAGVDSGGGYVVPQQYVAEIIELLRPKTVVLEMGATQMTNLVGSPVEVPRHTGAATGYWVAENATITASDQTFGQLNLTPKQAAALTKVSNRVLRLSSPSIEAIVRDDLAKVLARLIDLAALRGIGGSGQPLGIANTSGIGSVAIGTNGGLVSYDNLVDMITQLDINNALFGKLGFVFHPRMKAMIAKLKDNQNRPLFTWDPSVAQPSTTLLGYPWKTTSQIPTNLTKGSGTNLSEIYFANWEEVLWAQWGTLSLDASREAGTAFETNQTWVRIIQEVDIALRHAVSACLISDANSQ